MGANLCGCSNSFNNISQEETTNSSNVNDYNINILKLE